MWTYVDICGHAELRANTKSHTQSYMRPLPQLFHTNKCLLHHFSFKSPAYMHNLVWFEKRKKLYFQQKKVGKICCPTTGWGSHINWSGGQWSPLIATLSPPIWSARYKARFNQSAILSFAETFRDPHHQASVFLQSSALLDIIDFFLKHLKDKSWQGSNAEIKYRVYI